MSVFLALMGVVAGMFLATLGEFFSEEVRARIDRPAFAILKAAARRLPPEHRSEMHEEAWLPELHHILRSAEAMPITRLVNGCRYAVSLWFSAPSVGRELTGAERRTLRQVIAEIGAGPRGATLGDAAVPAITFLYFTPVLFMILPAGTPTTVGLWGFGVYTFVTTTIRQRWGRPYGRENKSRHFTPFEVVLAVRLMLPMAVLGAIYLVVTAMFAIGSGHGTVGSWLMIVYLVYMTLAGYSAWRIQVALIRQTGTGLLPGAARQAPGPPTG